MTLLRFLKLPCKSDKKYEIICVIFFFNVLVGFFCLRSWRSIGSISGNLKDARWSNGISVYKLLFPQRRHAVFPHPYEYIIPNTDFCSNSSMLLFMILVCTSTENFLERQTIRETWGSVVSLNKSTEAVKVGFLLGRTSNLTVQKRILEESSAHSDIIQGDFNDSYQNLTLKSVMLLKWTATFCSNVRYVLKTDDDMYINIENLINTFVKLPHASNSLYGVLFQEVKPIRDASSKWFVPEVQFKEEFFPDYLSGTSYAMSRDAVPKLLEASYDVPFLVLEDVFITGLCANKSGVARVPMQGFHFERLQPTGCSFKNSISGHHVTPSEMRTIWTELNSQSLVC